jgi:hypothetical protein
MNDSAPKVVESAGVVWVRISVAVSVACSIPFVVSVVRTVLGFNASQQFGETTQLLAVTLLIMTASWVGTMGVLRRWNRVLVVVLQLVPFIWTALVGAAVFVVNH